MATVTRENIGVLNEKIVVTVAKDDYLPSFEKAIKDYSKKANIPGFRKGMVPVGMVKKMYGSSVFADEVIKSVEKGLSEYMGSEKLDIFAQPLPIQENAPSMDMNQPSEYAFAFEIGLKPEFTLPNLDDAQLTRYKIIVTDEMINEAVQADLDRFAKVNEVETVASEENDLNITFTETDAEGNGMEEGIKETISVPVKSFSPAFREQLMGKNTGEAVALRLFEAFEEKEREGVATQLQLTKDGQPAEDKYFSILINTISTKEKPELNEAFFIQAYPEKELLTEEDYRNEIKNEMQSQWDASTLSQLHDQLFHAFLNLTQIDFPADFLKRWMVTNSDKPKTREEAEQEFPNFANQLKWSLITEKITNDNQIEVSAEEMKMFAKHQLFSYMGGQNFGFDQPWINDYVERMMKDKKFTEDTYHRILTDKVFSLTASQVHPTEVPISVEDFKQLLEAHKHQH